MDQPAEVSAIVVAADSREVSRTTNTDIEISNLKQQIEKIQIEIEELRKENDALFSVIHKRDSLTDHLYSKKMTRTRLYEQLDKFKKEDYTLLGGLYTEFLKETGKYNKLQLELNTESFNNVGIKQKIEPAKGSSFTALLFNNITRVLSLLKRENSKIKDM